MAIFFSGPWRSMRFLGFQFWRQTDSKSSWVFFSLDPWDDFQWLPGTGLDPADPQLLPWWWRSLVSTKHDRHPFWWRYLTEKIDAQGCFVDSFPLDTDDIADTSSLPSEWESDNMFKLVRCDLILIPAVGTSRVRSHRHRCRQAVYFWMTKAATFAQSSATNRSVERQVCISLGASRKIEVCCLWRFSTIFPMRWPGLLVRSSLKVDGQLMTMCHGDCLPLFGEEPRPHGWSHVLRSELTTLDGTWRLPRHAVPASSSKAPRMSICLFYSSWLTCRWNPQRCDQLHGWGLLDVFTGRWTELMTDCPASHVWLSGRVALMMFCAAATQIFEVHGNSMTAPCQGSRSTSRGLGCLPTGAFGGLIPKRMSKCQQMSGVRQAEQGWMWSCGPGGPGCWNKYFHRIP